MHMISGISVLIHHLDGEPLGVGAAVGVGPRGVGPWPGRLRSRRAAGVPPVGRGSRVVEGVAASDAAPLRVSSAQLRTL